MCIVLTGIWFRAARIIFLVTFSWYAQDVPFDARIEFAQIDAELHFIIVALRLIYVLQINLDILPVFMCGALRCTEVAGGKG